MTTALITCPCCGEAFDPLAVQQGREVAHYEAMLRQFGESRGLVTDYIGLFRSAPGAGQRLSTRAKLAGELLTLWRTGEFSFEGRAWRVSRGQINEALAEVLRVKGAAAGFKNHNYLKTILRQVASKAEAAQERERERGRRDPGQRLATEPEHLGGEEARPIEEWPLENVAAAYAEALRKPSVAKFMPDLTEAMRQRLLEEGLDMEKFARLAVPLETGGKPFSAAQGWRLIEVCRRAPSQPTPAGQCLPGIGAQDA